MCQIHNNRVPKGRDIIAYKVLYAKDNELFTPYQDFPMEIGKEYYTGRLTIAREGCAIDMGFFHSFKNMKDAKKWIKTIENITLKSYRIMKVLIPNTEKECLVYSGEFWASYQLEHVESYASNKIVILEEVYVPDTQ